MDWPQDTQSSSVFGLAVPWELNDRRDLSRQFQYCVTDHQNNQISKQGVWAKAA